MATAIFVAGFYGLYFGGIFDAAADSHGAHLAMNAHFLLSGYLFYWVVIGVDPTPRPIRRWPNSRWCSGRCRCTRSSVWS